MSSSLNSKPRKLKVKRKPSTATARPPGTEEVYIPIHLGLLEQLFPNIESSELRRVLDQCHGDRDRALDVFFEREKQREPQPTITTATIDTSRTVEESYEAVLDAWSNLSVKDESLPSPLVFLQTMFSESSEETLSAALEECDGKVEAATEYILSTGDYAEDTFSTISSVGSSTDTSEESSTKRDWLLDVASEETEHHVQAVWDMFPGCERATVVSTLKSCRGDVSKTVDLLVSLHSAAGGYNAPVGVKEMDRNDAALAALSELFPEKDLALLRNVLKQRGSLENATEYLLENPNPWMNENGSKSLRNGKSQRSSTGSSPPSSGTSVLRLVGSRTSSSLRYPGTSDKHRDHHDLINSTTLKEPSYYRQLSSALHAQRAEIFQVAASAYKRGKLAGKASAFHHATLGHEMTQEINQVNRLAMLATIQRNRKGCKDDDVLDLHGLTVKEAVEYVLEAVPAYFNSKDGSLAKGKRKSDLKIITGAGNHSRRGVKRLFPAVWRTLRSNGWVVKEGGEGWFYVSPRVDYK
ncbi:NEDD4-binding protein 2 [Gaertneriomyces sp. JEL0708]|nr:NEDD4-binding protein 2 [Gaertneriomyces sp. JEL0708]